MAGPVFMRVAQVVLTNGDVLEDKSICLHEGFVVVEADKEGQLPTWYNKDTVEALVQVDVPERKTGTPNVVFF